MRLWQRLLGDLRAREKWEAELAWFRLRYREPAGPTRCLKLLSRPAACGRIALVHLPGAAVSRLYLGLPESHARLLQRMARDFGLSPQPAPPDATKPPIRPMTAVSELPWSRPFVAHIVGEALYAGLIDEENHPHGAFLPGPSSALPPANWQLPAGPGPGITALPSWNGQEPPAHLVATRPDPRRWLLGRSRSGQPLHAPGRINIYGRQEAVAGWLTRQVMQMMAIDPANLVVIDGAGEMVPQLKRKTAVARLLGDGLAYLDLDSAPMTGGFNPLAAVPGETEEAMVQRWQQWFQGMSVHPQGGQLLVQARRDGVEDVPALRKWLRKAERQVQACHFTTFSAGSEHGRRVAAVSSLGLALDRLMADRALREWLEWPTNRFDVLPAGALFFACKNNGWGPQQLLRGVLLAALSLPEARLIAHGFPWKAFRDELPQWHEQITITNGPLLPDSTTVLVESRPQQVGPLVERFLAGDARLGENLSLLRPGEGIILAAGKTVFTTWHLDGDARP